MLVEKMAAAYWRLRRAYTYEVGLIRRRLDTATEDFYRKKNWEGQPRNETDEQIDEEIKQNVEEMKGWEKCRKRLSQMHDSGKPLDDTFEMEDLWDWLHEKYSCLLPRDANGEAMLFPVDELREFLNNNACWSDSDLWKALMGVCEEKVKEYRDEISDLEKRKEKNRLRLQVVKKLGSIPSKDELDRLLRYEGAIERQFYKAVNQLERLQRLRAGDNVPAPVEVDVDVNAGEGS
jgi:septation ring formation regulator EzrA